MAGIKKIIHIDMDAFFAAIEQRDFPEYRDKPLIVGGNPCSRGVVATCNYEARQYGIHSAMSCAKALQLCPHALFVKPRFEAYRSVSNTIRTIFAEFTPIFEPLSLDEAYLDVTDSADYQGSATRIALAIKTRIQEETGLTASAGISYNKFLAKIASDINKPDGLFVITPDQGLAFVEQLPIGKFHGIGKATEKKMHQLGVYSGNDLRKLSLTHLQQHFGKAGVYYYHIARAIDDRPVKWDRITKSVGVEITLPEDIDDGDEILTQLTALLEKAQTKLTDKNLQASTLTLKVKYFDFKQITRSRTFQEAISEKMDSTALFKDLLKSTDVGTKKVRLLGVTLSSLNDLEPESVAKQIDLFSPDN
ncbi:DNA polymerase IV [Methylicorpusculum sp.]|uniref:DNA polymerase IV n=1 Tax=Methylicorpusculum sp. TaxID=2713644 RepID=UPI00271B3FD4|nr:DNA polymerase IV [Methylicorpusculum sp.]MDO8844019.1 DNA polymerase IV [Methylicorpusculum sp.]